MNETAIEPTRPAPSAGPRPHRIAAALVSAALGMLAGIAPAAAQSQDGYPSRAVRVVVPYPAGGIVDLVARAVTEKLESELGQRVVVDARPGASGNVGIAEVLRAPADGYTLLVGVPNLATNPLLMPAVTKWKTSDFVGLGLVGAAPSVFVVPASLPVRSLKEFAEYARARPGRLNVANPGIGTSIHLGQELFFGVAGLDLNNVMYKGQPPAIPDLVSGQIAFNLMTATLALPHIREGKLRALAVGAPRRIADLPDVPTVSEAGFPEAQVMPWYGFVAAAGTPKRIVQTLSDAIQRALASPEVLARLDRLGAVVTPANGAAFDRLIASESVRWARVIGERNIRAPD